MNVDGKAGLTDPAAEVRSLLESMEGDLIVAIKLSIEVTSPLDADDHELLSGVSVMLLAVANHTLAQARFPEAFGDDETPAEETPVPCGALDPDEAGGMCVGNVGHRGRHRFRPASTPDADTSLLN